MYWFCLWLPVEMYGCNREREKTKTKTQKPPNHETNNKNLHFQLQEVFCVDILGFFTGSDQVSHLVCSQK